MKIAIGVASLFAITAVGAHAAVLDKIASKPTAYRAGYIANYIVTADNACVGVVGEADLPHIKTAGKVYWRLYEKNAAKDGFRDGGVDANVDRKQLTVQGPAGIAQWCAQVVEMSKENLEQ